jgi:hypothetical protein
MMECTGTALKETAVRVCQWEAVEPDGFGAKTTSEEESVKGQRRKEKCPHSHTLRNNTVTSIGESSRRSGEENGRVFRKCALMETTLAFDIYVRFCQTTRRQTQ